MGNGFTVLQSITNTCTPQNETVNWSTTIIKYQSQDPGVYYSRCLNSWEINIILVYLKKKHRDFVKTNNLITTTNDITCFDRLDHASSNVNCFPEIGAA